MAVVATPSVCQTDPRLHKRMMVLPTALALPAAFNQIDWLSVLVPSSILIHGLWGTQWWHATAPRLVGL